VLVKFPGVERLTGWENVLGIDQAGLRDILEPAIGKIGVVLLIRSVILN